MKSTHCYEISGEFLGAGYGAQKKTERHLDGVPSGDFRRREG